MRAPFQILVIPFRRTERGPEFCVLRRSDAGWWQFVAGGGEDDESTLEAAERETSEEIGIAAKGRLVPLDSMATVPKDSFAAADEWGDDLYVVPEHYFAIDVGADEPALSAEHTEYKWASHNEAREMLHWDSNRNGLWELSERLLNV